MFDTTELQQLVAKWHREHEMSDSVTTRLFCLGSEVGELQKEHCKGSNYGEVDFEPKAGWPLEMGDIFFALICLANQTDVDLEEAPQASMEKMEERWKENGRIGSGD
jgi:NTP pyrophosphatase (non-canonical NTP hydrolase)